jgi:cation:H+ antiporter
MFVAGLALLIAGSEALVRGASRLASGLGVSPLVVGLTVVAFGTGSPELAVSIKAALAGHDSIITGNIVGSNIFSVLFILGLSALIAPLRVQRQLVRLDVPLMLALSVLLLLLSLDNNISSGEGMLLVAALAGYLWFLFWLSRREGSPAQDEYAERPAAGSRARDIALILAGLVSLVLGSRWLVDSAVAFAYYLGVSELIIGLTIVAAGTSLPELATSFVAAVRGERDIAVGNVVGSNIFNILGVLGVSSLFASGGVEVTDAVIRFDMPVMIAVAFVCLPIFFTGGVISRLEGALLLVYYVAYTLYLVLAASHHDALQTFSPIMLFFVIPLTLVTILVLALDSARGRKGRRTR